jgi:phospholipase/carboxylesterase
LRVNDFDEPELIQPPDGGLTYRYRRGEAYRPAVVMLHGLGGDENVTWVLETALPSGWPILAPRAPFQFNGEGYSWVDRAVSGWPDMEDFRPAAARLAALVTSAGWEASRLILLGFSQGAALAMACAILGIIRPAAVIMAAGFIGQGDVRGISELPVFWGHGEKDEQVPISRARSDCRRLQQAGARVEFCSADVGHKLGLDCLRGLRTWLERTIAVR